MQTVLSSPALPCPFGRCFHCDFGISQGTAELSWKLPEQSLAGSSQSLAVGPTVSSIDLDRLKLRRVSHFHLLSAHPLEKRTGEAAEMCYSVALFNTDISVVGLLCSYKNFSSFSRATRTVLGHREQQMDLQWEQLPLLEAQAQRTGVCRNFDRVLLPKNLLWVVCKRPCSSSDVD